MNTIAYILTFSCAVHCLLLPFLVVSFPLIGHIYDLHFIELPLLLSSILIGCFITYKGYCKHKKQHTLVLFLIGALFWLAHMVLEVFHIHSSEFLLIGFGSVFVLGSYFLNHRYFMIITQVKKEVY